MAVKSSNTEKPTAAYDTPIALVHVSVYLLKRCAENTNRHTMFFWAKIITYTNLAEYFLVVRMFQQIWPS